MILQTFKPCSVVEPRTISDCLKGLCKGSRTRRPLVLKQVNWGRDLKNPGKMKLRMLEGRKEVAPHIVLYSSTFMFFLSDSASSCLLS
jgi:hypothetical protein